MNKGSVYFISEPFYLLGDLMIYNNMNEVPIGTKVKIKNSELMGNIIEIFLFPTTFKVEFEDGTFQIYKTHELEILEGSIDNENQ